MKRIFLRFPAVLLCLCVLLTFTGCGSESTPDEVKIEKANSSQDGNYRSNHSVVLVPSLAMEKTIGNDTIKIDISNIAEGYIVVAYTGAKERAKLQITGENQITYTINLTGNLDVIPLTSDSGSYQLTAYECIQGNEFAMIYSDVLDVSLENAKGPYLYPNLYVNFTQDSECVSVASELAKDATCDLDVVAKVYSYVVDNIEYDHEEAENVASNYLPNTDEIMETRKGICLDYASLMAAMLRSQRIPTRLEIGYAKDAYHSWISVFTEDEGWVSGIIEFNGQNWTLMDPTFAANSSAKKLKSFIGDGTNYTTKYTY